MKKGEEISVLKRRRCLLFKGFIERVPIPRTTMHCDADRDSKMQSDLTGNMLCGMCLCLKFCALRSVF